MHTAKLRLLYVLVVLGCGLLFTGCLKDECQNTYTIYRPIYQRLSDVRAQMKWEPAQAIEKPGKIYLYGKYLLMNDVGKGIHVFDNSTASSPRKLGFLRVGGNVDMAIRNNVLYADSYSDLAIIPIQDWASAKPAFFRNRVFADRGFVWGNSTNPDSVQVIVGYEQKDTVVDCETVQTWNNCANCAFSDASGRPILASAQAAAAAPSNGIGGSMARFTLVNDYLYTVSTSNLTTFRVTDALNPVQTHSQQLGWNIETIYPFADRLFVGSMTGMFTLSIANPATPSLQGRFDHARVCDPVIADDKYAFVTLRSGGNACAGTLNQLDVLDISNLSLPSLVKSYGLQNPHGLSKDGTRLFICDGAAGLKLFDATNPRDLKLLRTLDGIGTTFDVIAHEGVALVVTDKGLLQYAYTTDSDNLRLLSKIDLN